LKTWQSSLRSPATFRHAENPDWLHFLQQCQNHAALRRQIVPNAETPHPNEKDIAHETTTPLAEIRDRHQCCPRARNAMDSRPTPQTCDPADCGCENCRGWTLIRPHLAGLDAKA
jgi:hypothetical protein